MIKTSFKYLINSLPIPEHLRYELMKFYLINIERTHDTYTSGLTPGHFRSSLKLWQIINRDQGHLRSFAEGRCLDSSGQPIPWYTYPALEHLSQLNFSEKAVFEYGAGNSTLWWAKRAKSVTSVEIREAWYERIKATMPSNCQLLLETEPDAYIESIKRFPEGFDVIVIDGYARKGGRLQCSAMALECLRPKGIVILDNADWLPMSAQVLRNGGLLEVNMAGFSPLNAYAGVTSLFFTRDCDISRKDFQSPATAIGGVVQLWEKETNVPAELRARLNL